MTEQIVYPLGLLERDPRVANILIILLGRQDDRGPWGPHCEEIAMIDAQLPGKGRPLAAIACLALRKLAFDCRDMTGGSRRTNTLIQCHQVHGLAPTT